MLFLKKKKIPFEDIIPDNYIDIHSHLLPGIDDGVKTIYQSAYVLEQFYHMGVTKLITTPHSMKDVWPNTADIIMAKLKEMKTLLPTLDIPINLHAAAEYMLDDLFLKHLKDKDVLTLKDTYILVEMSTFNPPINLNELLFDIKLSEYIPILAHPERYSFYHNNFQKFAELKDSGFLFQLNLLSISGYYGERVKKTALRLLEEGYYDFSGSDVHNRKQFESLEKGFYSKDAKKLKILMENNRQFA